jgi:tetratricopeptide (TPR) repeat protein
LVRDETFDVFISYGHHDAAWVHTFAENLRRVGLEVFLDKWEIAPGDVVVHQLERGLLNSRNGILVVGPASVARPWVQQEYAVMVDRAVAGKQRLIPVLLGEVEVPPFAATRLWVDFRGLDGPEYERRLRQLAAALRGERPERPPRDGELLGPPGSGFRPEGPRRATLRIEPDRTVLEVEGKEVAGRPPGPSYRLEERLWELQRARYLGPRTAEVALRTPDQPATGGATIHARLVEVGAGLAKAFLPDPVRGWLAEQVRLAVDQNAALRLAVEVIADGLVDLPWEALSLAELEGGPLVLHPRVEFYRAVAGLGVTPAIRIPGPLRILVVIGSPDQGERGELLDYEAELQRILDAVEPARRQDRAYVRVLNRGTLPEVRAALQAQRFHVLHISCHAYPGALVLEDESGGPDLVTAARLAGEVLVANRGVPLLVLSGCSTALSERATQQSAEEADANGPGEAALPGLARQLLGHGVPAVLAMNAPVTDPYAARLGARLYQELAAQHQPDPVAAVSQARRQVDAELRKAPAGSREARLAELAEWATPTLSVRGLSLPLFDPAEALEELQASAKLRLAAGIVVREVGDFVGRRREQRLLLSELRGQRAGVLIYGIGGVGKSTLAAQLVADLGEQAGLLVSLAGRITADQILHETGRRLLSVCLARRLDEEHPWRQLAWLLREPKVDWADRLDLLGEHLLGQQPVMLLLDNFEDNLQPASNGAPGFEVVDPQLAGFLAAWVAARGMDRLLVTCRYPFALPNNAERRLAAHHLGPLSLAETRKLVWRLPGLDRLAPAQLERAYADVGGHPRALEYLDALLRDGQARFDDVTDRLERALAKQQIDDPAGRLAGVQGNLNRALTDTITLTVKDTLLRELLTRVDPIPLARRLLLGVSVYRIPVDLDGIKWQASNVAILSSNPLNSERFEELAEGLAASIAQDPTPKGDKEHPLGPEAAAFLEHLTTTRRPSVSVDKGFENALSTLIDLGLITPINSDDENGNHKSHYLVHRWTARELTELVDRSEARAAHSRAALYWVWQSWDRIRRPQGWQHLIDGLLEARYHFHAAGEDSEAVHLTQQIASMLEAQGAWSWEEQLCQEALSWLPEHSPDAAKFHGHLGSISQRRGDYDQATERARKAQNVFSALDDEMGVANTHHTLGNIGYLQGDYLQAEHEYRRALTIFERIDERGKVGKIQHQLGMVAELTGSRSLAENLYHKALIIHKEVGDLTAAANTCQQLSIMARESDDYEQAAAWQREALRLYKISMDQPGLAHALLQSSAMARRANDYDEALKLARLSLMIYEEIGDRSGLADCYIHLGHIAYAHKEYRRSEDWYLRALHLEEELGERRDIAGTCYQLGLVAHARNHSDKALEWYHRALTGFEEIGSKEDIASVTSQVGILLTQLDAADSAVIYNLRSLSIRLDIGSPQMGVDVFWLRQQWQLLGEARFSALLHSYVDDASVQPLLELLSGPDDGPKVDGA